MRNHKYIFFSKLNAPIIIIGPRVILLYASSLILMGLLTRECVTMICYRISGNAASNKNIHGTVSAQLKKNFAKSRWKVRSTPSSCKLTAT